MKSSINLLAVVIILGSCNEIGSTKAETALEEAKCKVELSKFLLENGTNTEMLGRDLGFGDELDNFHKLQVDSTVTCDSLRSIWQDLSDKIDSASH